MFVCEVCHATDPDRHAAWCTSQLLRPIVDMVNHPPHYKQGGIETIDVIEAWELGFCLGNAVKYISRAGKKNAAKTLEDLKKARWYLDREISRLEQE